MAGETTAALSTKAVRKLAGPGLTAFTWALPYSTAQNEAADIMQAGYLPAGVIVTGITLAPSASMAASALVMKVTIGSTDVVTGATAGVTPTRTHYPIVPITTTATTLVSITTTTAATTPAAATMHLTVFYYTA